MGVVTALLPEMEKLRFWRIQKSTSATGTFLHPRLTAYYVDWLVRLVKLAPHECGASTYGQAQLCEVVNPGSFASDPRVLQHRAENRQPRRQRLEVDSIGPDGSVPESYGTHLGHLPLRARRTRRRRVAVHPSCSFSFSPQRLQDVLRENIKVDESKPDEDADDAKSSSSSSSSAEQKVKDSEIVKSKDKQREKKDKEKSKDADKAKDKDKDTNNEKDKGSKDKDRKRRDADREKDRGKDKEKAKDKNHKEKKDKDKEKDRDRSKKKARSDES